MITKILLITVAAVSCALFSSTAIAAEPGPAAHYTFDEGSGGVLHDTSGNNAHGKITGGKWVQNGRKWALEFDGRTTTVDCGTPECLNLDKQMSMTGWLYAEPFHSIFLKLPILDNGQHIVLHAVNNFQVDTAGWGYGYGLLPTRKWTHFAITWDGKNTIMYVDGVLITHSAGQTAEIPERENFVIAGMRNRDMAEGGPEQKEARFKGRMASLKVFKRVLSYEEVLDDIRSSNITGNVELMPIPQPGLGVVRVEADAARLGVPLEGVTVTVELAGPDSETASIQTASIEVFDNLGVGAVDLKVPGLSKGAYTLRATAMNADGKVVGDTASTSLEWAGSAQFPTGTPGARWLNNLVTELVNVPGPDHTGVAHTFVNPRTGFVFISNRGSQEVKVTPEGGEPMALTLTNDYGDAFETQRYLPEGTYTITTADAQELIVRAVPLTVYDYAFTQPHVGEYGNYAGLFEEKYVFPHANTWLVHEGSMDHPDYAPLVKKWKARGRRMLGDGRVNGPAPKEGQSPQTAIAEYLTNHKAFTHRDFDGLFLDEFSNSGPHCSSWAKGIDEALSRPEHANRSLLVYDFALYDFLGPWFGPGGREMMDALRKHDSSVLWEAYVDNQQTESKALRMLREKLVGEVDAANRLYPGFVKNLAVDFYSYVEGGPKWNTHSIPGIDIRVWMDMQFQLVATDPTFVNLQGLAVYRSPYASEEMARFAARLFRHYGIEGKTERFLKDPYVLTHVENGDFEWGIKGWNTDAAEAESIRFDVSRVMVSAQDRYGFGQGMCGVITKRSDKKPNVFSQEIKDLEPGRLYSFRMYSADINNIKNAEKHAVAIEISNVDLVADKGFTHIGSPNPNPENKINWHARVFRAKDKTATLRVSDWADDKTPGGPTGQELMYNYIKVQPYLPSDELEAPQAEASGNEAKMFIPM